MKYLLVSIFVVCLLGFARGDGPGDGVLLDQIPEESSYAEDDSDMYMEPAEPVPKAADVEDGEKSENSFYPSYSQPLGHSRPFYFQQEGAYSQRSQPPFQQVFEAPARYDNFKENYAKPSAAAATETHALLGSGNFGVISGGTFYNDNDGEQSESSSYGDYNSYFHNGHGRPSFYGGRRGNPKPQPQEQFANFKDFADINTPSDRQYSQFVVVYANKNASKEELSSNKVIQKPKNIIESLTMLDYEPTTISEEVPEKKLSKSKRKLAKLLPEKKYKVVLLNKEKLSKDLSEPLLALS